jgi:hypothetical protein
VETVDRHILIVALRHRRTKARTFRRKVRVLRTTAFRGDGAFGKDATTEANNPMKTEIAATS